MKELVDIALDLTNDDLQKLMDISPKLAELNRERFQDFGNQEKKNCCLIIVYMVSQQDQKKLLILWKIY